MTEDEESTGSSALRVGLLTASLDERGGGVMQAVRSLAFALRQQAGLHVRVYGGSAGGAESGFATFPSRGPVAFGYLPGLERALCADNLEVAHSHGLWMYPSIASMGWSAGRRPYVISPHGMLDTWALRNSGWKKKAAGWLYENRHLRGASCLHALNRSEASAARDYGLTAPICVIPNGVDLAETQAAIDGDEKVCLFLGRLHPKKGLTRLLRAWADAEPAGWKLKVAGWDQGGHLGELEALAATLGIADSVRFVGPKFGAEKFELLRTASAFVLPSLSEGLPVAVLEAWSFGLPVAMTLECNIPEGFESEAAVRLQPDENGALLGLESLTAMSRDELRAMGARGRRLVEERFTWDRIAEEMASVYRWVLGRGPRPDCVETV